MLIWGFIPPLGWGVNSSLIGHSSKKIGSLATGIGAQFIGFFITLAFFIFFPIFNFPQHTWVHFIFNGVAGAVLFWALCHIFSIAQASVVTPIIASWTIIAALFGVIILKDPFSFHKLIAITIVVLGIIFLTFDIKTLLQKNTQIISPGTGLAMLLAIGLGLNAFVSSFVVKEIGWLSATTGIRLITVITMLAIISFQDRSTAFSTIPLKSRLVWTIAVFDVIAFSSFNIALTTTKFSVVAILAALGPLITTATSVIFFKERPKLVQILGGFLAVSGVVLFQI